MKDNSYRCPWCGNFVKKANRYNILTQSYECPFCEHNYCCGTDRTPFIIIPIAVLLAFVRVRYYWIFLALVLISTIYKDTPLLSTPMVRYQDTIMPEKGYKAEIEMYEHQNKMQLKNDIIIPIVFISDDGKPVSSLCCVRIENGKWRKNIFTCNLRLLTCGESPQSESAKIYLYNKGQVIAHGKILEKLGLSY